MTYRLFDFIECNAPGCDQVFHGTLNHAVCHGWAVYVGGLITCCPSRKCVTWGFQMFHQWDAKRPA